jgi:hypothetical protein
MLPDISEEPHGDNNNFWVQQLTGRFTRVLFRGRERGAFFGSV